MRSRLTPCWAWLFLLFVGFFLCAPLAAGQMPPLPQQSQLTPDVRGRLLEGARDSTIAPWQREFMLEVARGRVEGGAVEPSPALPGLAPTPAGIIANDGTWTAVPPPIGRSGHTAIYDPVRDRMVVFGGYDGIGYRNEVWALSLAGSPAWSALAPAGTLPAVRNLHTAIYDPVRDRMVVFGGYDGSFRNDAWALSLAGSPSWSALTPAGTLPSGRYSHTAIYDPVRDRMVVFGGYDGISLGNDVWALSLAGNPAWSALAPAGTPPAGRYQHTAIYDPVRDRMVVFGGFGGTIHNDVWALSLAGSAAWSALAPAGTLPAARYLHTAFYDPARDRMLVFGGGDGISLRNDVWALSLAGSPAWSALAPAGTLPSGRYIHTTFYDPVRDRMVMFGGYDRIDFRNDVWALTLAGSPAWSVLTPAGTPPSARSGHTAFYDPVRDRMLVFGGYDGSSLRNDVGALSLAGSPTWSALAPAGTPPSARQGPTAIYDPVRDRMLVFGGYDGSSFRNDVWALSLAGSPAWSALATAGTLPSARYLHTAFYDPVRDRMLVFGGADGSSLRNDVWALSLAGSPGWSALAPAGTLPAERDLSTATYDPVRDRMVVFGGHDGNPHNDVWALSLAGSPAWSALAPAGKWPSARYGHTAFYDPVRDRMVVFGGSDGLLRNDVWALGWAPIVSVPRDGISRRFALAPPRPNPSRGETTLDFELREPARVVLDVFDAQGRRVKRIADEWFTAGRHASTWRGDDDRGHMLGGGVYFIRVQVGGVQATRRTVRVR